MSGGRIIKPGSGNLSRAVGDIHPGAGSRETTVSSFGPPAVTLAFQGKLRSMSQPRRIEGSGDEMPPREVIGFVGLPDES